MAADATPGRRSATGADHFWLAQRLTIGALAIGIVLQILLFARPTPSGVAYVGDWYRYFFRALLYEGLENYLLALPFLALWLILFRRVVTVRLARWPHATLLGVLAVSLFLTEFDHEIMRFVGTRATLSYLQVYATTGTSWPVVFDSLLTDRGGPLIPVALWIGAPVALLVWGRRQISAAVVAGARRGGIAVAIASVGLPILAPIYVRQNLGGKGPTRRVESLVLSVARDLTTRVGPIEEPADFPKLAKRYQQRWLADDGDPSWKFTSTTFPYLREPIETASPAPDDRRWNIVVFQLETFRAWDMALMRPGLVLQPTPFLDALGRSDRGAYWARASSFGPPTVNGFIAWNCSLLPHSGELALTTFTYTALDCLPDAFRRHGYRTEVFTGFDPDWDNETLWYRRWYDQFHYFHEAAGDDRVLTRLTAHRLETLGRGGQPFFATVVCITNHYPFTSRDESFDIAGRKTATERILNTMHYDDSAIRAFMDSIRNEPWFERTLFAFVGDHGYNLGEHGASPGQFNLYRESTWVPLVIAGSHPRLAAGRREEPASLLDLAPTLADLAGIREPTPWLGHSLIGVGRSLNVAFAREDVMFAETPEFSLVVDPDTERPLVFDPVADPLQHHELGARVPPGFVSKMLERAEEARRLNDYLIRSNRIVPH